MTRVWAVPIVCFALAGCSSEDGANGTDGGVDVSEAADAEAPPNDPTYQQDLRCPLGMAYVPAFCIDRFEDHVVAVDDAGAETPHSPYDVIDGGTMRAKTARGVVPQGYISQVQAAAACANAGKRLCDQDEFVVACRGLDSANQYPYGGTTRKPGDCNEGKGSSMPMFYGNDPQKWTYAAFNDPKLNQWDGGLAKTGAYPNCVSPFGVYDCVGNLHEWGSDAPDTKGHGRFRGGFYGDAEINGHGCLYVTSAHEVAYHDYSTGFRCCRDPLP
ncbi:hypothetical protein BH09MYX1_BH09MYX1_50060 [soil metagenome]